MSYGKRSYLEFAIIHKCNSNRLIEGVFVKVILKLVESRFKLNCEQFARVITIMKNDRLKFLYYRI